MSASPSPGIAARVHSRHAPPEKLDFCVFYESYEEAIQGNKLKKYATSKVLAREHEISRLLEMQCLIGPVPETTHIPRECLVKARYVDTEAKAGLVGFKSRMVALGYQDMQCDRNTVYSPASSYELHRILLTHAASHGYVSGILDISQAFLNAPFSRRLFVQIPNTCTLYPGQIF